MKLTFLILACITAIIGDLLSVWWANSSASWWLLIPIFLVSNLAGLAWIWAIKIGIGTTFAILLYSIGTIIGCSMIAYLFFGEALSLINMCGVALACIAIIMMTV